VRYYTHLDEMSQTGSRGPAVFRHEPDGILCALSLLAVSYILGNKSVIRRVFQPATQ
jgi:hypothetical protein